MKCTKGEIVGESMFFFCPGFLPRIFFPGQKQNFNYCPGFLPHKNQKSGAIYCPGILPYKNIKEFKSNFVLKVFPLISALGSALDDLDFACNRWIREKQLKEIIPKDVACFPL